MPFPPPGDLPDPGIEPRSPAGSLLYCRQIFLPTEPPYIYTYIFLSVLYYGSFETSIEVGRILLCNSTHTPASKIVFLAIFDSFVPLHFLFFFFFCWSGFFFLKQIPDIISFHCKYFSPYH